MTSFPYRGLSVGLDVTQPGRERSRCYWQQLCFPNPFLTRRLRPRDTQPSILCPPSKPIRARTSVTITPLTPVRNPATTTASMKIDFPALQQV